MQMFVEEWGLAVAILIAAGVCGGGFLAPFAATSPRLTYIAPAAGLIVVPFCASAFYQLLNVSYDAAALISALTCATVRTLAIYVYRPRLTIKDAALDAGLFLLVAAILILVTDTAAIRTGSHAILFMDGSDQSGYGQVADWLRDHLAGARPRPAPEFPNESWPSCYSVYQGSIIRLPVNYWTMFGRSCNGFDCTAKMLEVVLIIRAAIRLGNIDRVRNAKDFGGIE